MVNFTLAINENNNTSPTPVIRTYKLSLISIHLVTFLFYFICISLLKSKSLTYALPLPLAGYEHNSSTRRRKQRDISPYHHTKDIIKIIRGICQRCPHADAEWTAISTTRNSRFPLLPALPGGRFQPHTDSILTVTLTHNAAARNAARRAGGLVTPRTSVVASFGEHGRERITSELALRIVRLVCDTEVQNELNTPENIRLLQEIELVLLPIVNEHGRIKVEAGDECWRLNSRGVDLNRNYVRGWGMYDGETIKEEEKSGRAPLSEYEARGVDAVVRRFHPSAYVSIHSGDVAVLSPWDGYGEDTSIGQWVRDVAKKVGDEHCGGGCMVGRARQAFGYSAYGTGVDHMIAERGVDVAMTVEVWGGDEMRCESMFNPGTLADYETVMRNWSSVLHTVAHIMHDTKIGNGTGFAQRQWQEQGNKLPAWKVIGDVLKVQAGKSEEGYVVHWESDGEHEAYQQGDNGGNSIEHTAARWKEGYVAMALLPLAVPINRLWRRHSQRRPRNNRSSAPDGTRAAGAEFGGKQPLVGGARTALNK